MKVLLSWLRDFAPFEGDPVALGEEMSDLGMAVEQLDWIGRGLEGIVVARVQPGDPVAAGQEVMVIEAMKMELSLKAPREGVVAEVRGAAGDFVEADAALVLLEAAS